MYDSFATGFGRNLCVGRFFWSTSTLTTKNLGVCNTVYIQYIFPYISLGPKLVDLWLGKGSTILRLPETIESNLSKEKAEYIIAHLIIDGYLKEDFHFTPYSTISYIAPGMLIIRYFFLFKCPQEGKICLYFFLHSLLTLSLSLSFSPS